MGTRHLIVAMVDGEHRIAQYGQWDGYPEGQGKTVCEFVASLDGDALKKFRANLRKCSYMTHEERYKLIKSRCNVSPDGKSIKVDNKLHAFNRRFPELCRDTGARILGLVLDGPACLVDDYSFAADSLFCEFAYVVDTDRKMIEYHKGWNKVPAVGRFASLPLSDDAGEYCQVTLVDTVPFAECAEAWLKWEKLEEDE